MFLCFGKVFWVFEKQSVGYDPFKNIASIPADDAASSTATSRDVAGLYDNYKSNPIIDEFLQVVNYISFKTSEIESYKDLSDIAFTIAVASFKCLLSSTLVPWLRSRNTHFSGARCNDLQLYFFQTLGKFHSVHLRTFLFACRINQIEQSKEQDGMEFSIMEDMSEHRVLGIVYFLWKLQYYMYLCHGINYWANLIKSENNFLILKTLNFRV